MTETSDFATRLSELDRRHDKTRELLIDGVSMITGLLAGFYYEPEGLLASLGVIWGAMFLARFLWPFCGVLFAVLSVVIYLATLMQVTSTLLWAHVLTMFLPVIAQAYWIWAAWAATGVLFHPFAVLCAVWLALLGIVVFEYAWARRKERRHQALVREFAPQDEFAAAMAPPWRGAKGR